MSNSTRVRSIRQPIPKGTVIGRAKAGNGPVELLSMDRLIVAAVASGAIPPSGGGGGGGITQLTGDVAAGPGSGSQVATIQPLAVTTGKIADANVTTAKLADLNVTTGKIAANAVTTAKLSTTGVAAGAYTNVSLTVGVDGRITVIASGASAGAMMPLVNGDTSPGTGPYPIATPDGQFIGVPL